MLYDEESTMEIHESVDISEQNEVVIEESVAEWCPEPEVSEIKVLFGS